MRYASEESKLNFQEAIATRQLMVEKNREEWNRLRDINMRYLRAGKGFDNPFYHIGGYCDTGDI